MSLFYLHSGRNCSEFLPAIKHVLLLGSLLHQDKDTHLKPQYKYPKVCVYYTTMNFIHDASFLLFSQYRFR